MKVDVLDRTDVQKRFSEAASSKRFWILILSPTVDTSILHTIEKRYYKPGTEANKDFTLIINPDMSVFAFFTKARMSRDELSSIVGNSIPKDKDIIFGV